MTLGIASPAVAQLFDASSVRTLGMRELGPRSPGLAAPGVSSCIAGEFTGDARLDVVVIADGQARLAWAPSHYESLPLVAQSAASAALGVPANAVNGNTLFTLDAAGLTMRKHDPVRGTFGVMAIGSSAWNTASRLCSGDLDADGTIDVYALGASQLSVLQLTGIEGATPEELSFGLSSAATGVTTLDWSGSLAREFAIATASTIEIHRRRGAHVVSLPIAGAESRLAVLARPSGGGFERLAAVVRIGNVDVLTVVGEGIAAFTLVLGDQQVNAIATGDLDLNGAADIVIARASSGNPLYLLQHADGSFALDGSSGIVDLGASAPNADNAPFTLGDFDSDGDVDVLAYVPEVHSLRLAANAIVNARDGAPSAIGTRFLEVITVLGEPAECRLELEVNAPTRPNAGTTHLEITAWRQAAATGGPELDAVARVLVPLLGNPAYSFRVQVPFGSLANAALLHEIEIREIVLDASGPATAAGPAALLCHSSDLERLEELCKHRGLAFSPLLSIVPWVTLLPPGVAPDTSELGTGIVPMGDVPKFEDDDEITDVKLPDPDWTWFGYL